MRLKAPVRSVVSLALCVLVLACVAWQIVQTWDSAALSRIRPVWLISGTTLATAGLLGFAVVCRAILAVHGAAVSLGESVGLVYVPQLGKYLPGRGWTVPASLWAYARAGVAMTTAVRCIAWSFVISFSSSLAVAGILGSPLSGTSLAISSAVGLAGLWFLPGGLRRAADLVLIWRGRAPLDGPLIGRAVLLRLLAGNGLAWLVYGLGFVCLASSVEPISLNAAPRLAALFAFAQIAGFLAIFAPAGLGVREGVLIVGLAPIVGEANASAIAVLCRVWQTGLELVLAACGWWALHVPATEREECRQAVIQDTGAPPCH